MREVQRYIVATLPGRLTRDCVEVVKARDYDALKAENERWRRDAERYRWICQFPEDADYEVTHALNGCCLPGSVDGPSFRDLLSDAIDASLASAGDKGAI